MNKPSAPELVSLHNAWEHCSLSEDASRWPMFTPITNTDSCKTEVGSSSDLVPSWRYSSDSDDDNSVSSVDTADNDSVTKGRWSPFSPELICRSICPASGSSTRSSSISLLSVADVSSVSSGNSTAGLSPAKRAEYMAGKCGADDDSKPTHRVYSNRTIDSSCGIAHPSRDASPMAASVHCCHSMNSLSPLKRSELTTNKGFKADSNTKLTRSNLLQIRTEGAISSNPSRDASPVGSVHSYHSMSSLSPAGKADQSPDRRRCVGEPSPTRLYVSGTKADTTHDGTHRSRDPSPAAAVREDSTFQRHVEHDLLQQRDQLVLLTREPRVPHVHIQVQEKTAEELVAHSTAVMRTTRNGQAVLRRNYGVPGAPSPAGTRMRAAFSVFGEQRRGSGSAGGHAQDTGHGTTLRNLVRTGGASDTMIDCIEEYLGGLGCSQQGFAKPTIGTILNTAPHRK